MRGVRVVEASNPGPLRLRLPHHHSATLHSVLSMSTEPGSPSEIREAHDLLHTVGAGSSTVPALSRELMLNVDFPRQE